MIDRMATRQEITDIKALSFHLEDIIWMMGKEIERLNASFSEIDGIRKSPYIAVMISETIMEAYEIINESGTLAKHLRERLEELASEIQEYLESMQKMDR